MKTSDDVLERSNGAAKAARTSEHIVGCNNQEISLEEQIKITRLEPTQRQGLIVIITGNGKGKTTSAMGMALRGCGHGLKTTIVQFMKGDLYSGEWDGVDKLAPLVTLHHTGKGFCGIEGNPFPHSEHRKNAQDALTLIKNIIKDDIPDTLILDEVNNALQLKLIDLDQVLEIVDMRPEQMHLVLTGRDAHPDLIALADTVSEVQEIKHAYRKDIEPQPGIDF
jgi:cob(I)alamin adenosyltransferase